MGPTIMLRALAKSIPVALRQVKAVAPTRRVTAGVSAAAAAFATGSLVASCDSKHFKSDMPHAGIPGTNFERTFLAVKPDGVQRGIVSDVIARFEKRGYKLVGLKLVQPTQQMAENHYADLSTKKFFPGLTKFFSSGPIVAMCWEGKDVIKQGRQMLGQTQPLDSMPGSVRGDYSIELGRNIMHGSDAADSAAHELGMWFKPEELCNWEKTSDQHIYEWFSNSASNRSSLFVGRLTQTASE